MKSSLSDRKPRILVTGASGQLGSELVPVLRSEYGNDAVIAADIRRGSEYYLDVTDNAELQRLILQQDITQIYHLAALLSARGEQNPMFTWNLNMTGLLNILEAAKDYHLEKVFWPSSIAVFGPGSERAACPQHTVMEPATMYGITKSAGENLCRYYHENYGLDVRSLRYPGLISYKGMPGGGTTDYAVDIFHQAVAQNNYTCFLKESTTLPMLYMADAIRATLELMEAPAENLTIWSSYNLWGMSFSPRQLADEIMRHIPEFKISYAPDFRQAIAESWPTSIDDRHARKDWGWKQEYDLKAMAADMLHQLQARKSPVDA